MAELTLRFDPLDARVVCDPAERATWGSLSIEIEHAQGRRTNLTELLDLRANGLRERVDGTVLPLAEWLVRNWFVIFHSRHLPPDTLTPRRAAYRWRRSHGLRFVGEGCALPDLQIYRSSESCVDLAWRRDNADDGSPSPVRFTAEDNSVSIPKDAVEQSLSAFVDLIVRRCELHASASPRTHELSAAWRDNRDNNSPHRRAKEFAARFDEPWERIHASMRHLLSTPTVDHPVAEVLADLSSADDVDGFERSVSRVSHALGAAKPAPKELRELRAQLTPSDEPTAWRRGWNDARALRTKLGLSHDRAASPPAGLGVQPQGDLGGLTRANDAVVAWNGDSGAVVFAAGQSKFSERRNLWPVLFAGDPSAPAAYALSRSIWGVTSVANAFATELLAPVEHVRHELAGREQVLESEVDDISKSMRAPFHCVLHQIENHELAVVVNDQG